MNYPIVIIIGVFIYTIIFWLFNLYKSQPWMSYILTIYNMGVIIAFPIGFIINLSEINRKDRIDAVSRLGHDKQTGFIDIEKNFMNHYPESLPLYKELNKQNPIIQAKPIPIHIDPVKEANMNQPCAILLYKV